MNITESCLKLLKEKRWGELNTLLSNSSNSSELASDPIFKVFEDNLVTEIKRSENETKEDLFIVLANIWQLNQSSKVILSEKCMYQITDYLFKKHPSEKYAILLDTTEARAFLSKKSDEREQEIKKTILATSLNIKIGETGKLDFSKSIFNSPQEQELYLAAKRVFKNEILLPNIALSSIIDSNITQILDQKTTSFFYKSTLDLCIVNENDYKPLLFIELDSSWHDKTKQIENDKMKNNIFKEAGLVLHRLRKKENKPMSEIFEIYISKI